MSAFTSGSTDGRGQWQSRLGPTPSAAVTVAGLLGIAWTATYLAGGTRTALPHLFYLAIVVAAVTFGAKGGFVTGVVAAVLCGPLLPIDVVSSEPQLLVNWLVRGAFFVTLGLLIGGIVTALRGAYRSAIMFRIDRELELATGQPVGLSAEAGARVRRVLQERRFHTVFQPIFMLDDGRLLAVEALTRFEMDPYEPPDVWFERAAALGIGIELELAAVTAALEAADLRLPSDIALSLNCSPATVCDPDLLALVKRFAPRQVILEVTEHAIVCDYVRLGTAMSALRAQGVRLAVDDAGAGFSSLRHIVRLAPEIIKLDISLTQDIKHDPILGALADALIRFADQTGSWLIAEGIETTADLNAWRGLGAHAAQGFLLGRPGPLPPPDRHHALTASSVAAFR